MKKIGIFFIVVMIFTCFSCSTTKKLSESSTKTDVIKNYESYINAYNWLYFNGYIIQRDPLFNIDKDFLKMKRRVENIELADWNIEWNRLLKDPSYISLSDIGEQLVKYKNNRMIYQLSEGMTDASNNIKSRL